MLTKPPHFQPEPILFYADHKGDTFHLVVSEVNSGPDPADRILDAHVEHFLNAKMPKYKCKPELVRSDRYHSSKRRRLAAKLMDKTKKLRAVPREELDWDVEDIDIGYWRGL